MELERQALLKKAEEEALGAIREAPDRESCLRGLVEAIHRTMTSYDWVGIYLVEGETLVLGPFVGEPTEHTRIPVGEGICGRAVREGKNQIIRDVTADPEHIACSLSTRSEIVVLIRDGDRILGQIDIDSDRPALFDKDDESMLQRVADRLAPRLR